MKLLLILSLAVIFTLQGCGQDDPTDQPKQYNFYFNITHDGRNIFTYDKYDQDQTGFRTIGETQPFAEEYGYILQDTLFLWEEATNSGGFSDQQQFILDFGNGDMDSIYFNNNNPIYEIFYNGDLVETYDLSDEDFEYAFSQRNGFGNFDGNPNPIIITVEKDLEVE